MSEQPKHLFVDGIVAARNKVPYVTISTEQGIVVQLDVADARQVAADILQAAGNAEADAMILKFFAKADFPEAAGAAMMIEFREFRHELDSAENRARAVKPDEGV